MYNGQWLPSFTWRAPACVERDGFGRRDRSVWGEPELLARPPAHARL